MKFLKRAAAICVAVLALTAAGTFTHAASAKWQAQNIKYLGI
jgi:hypothetical protein